MQELIRRYHTDEEMEEKKQLRGKRKAARAKNRKTKPDYSVNRKIVFSKN